MAAEYPAFTEVRILKDFGGRDRVLALKLLIGVGKAD
jgi:hypothetical protein